MDWVEASVETVRGMVSSRWEKSDGSLQLEITIPANTSGKVTIPKLDWEDVQILESGETIWSAGEIVENDYQISSGTEDDEYVILEMESGSYEFEIRKTAR